MYNKCLCLLCYIVFPYLFLHAWLPLHWVVTSADTQRTSIHVTASQLGDSKSDFPCSNLEWKRKEEIILKEISAIDSQAKNEYLSNCFNVTHKRFCHKPEVPKVERKCHPQDSMRFLTKEEADKRGLFLLASYPGSGNTWSRLILEELTGIYTGSTYCDKTLLASGHFGEGMQSSVTIAVKAHIFRIYSSKFNVIYLVRNPYHSLFSRLAWKSTRAHTKVFHKG